MRIIESITKDNSTVAVTVTPTRITLKFPLCFNEETKDKWTKIILSRVENLEVEKSLRGRLSSGFSWVSLYDDKGKLFFTVELGEILIYETHNG